MIDIMRKDLRLLWKHLAAVLTLYTIAVAPLALRFDSQAARTDIFALEASVAAAFFLLTALVQTDSIPSDRQDWLVRPIPRLRLIGAKVAFALLFAVLPVMAIEFVIGLAAGLEPLRMLIAVFRHGVGISLMFILPMLALGSVCRNAAESVLAAVILLSTAYVAQSFNHDSIHIPRFSSMANLAGLLAMAGAALAILAMQYLRRWTKWSRILTVAAFPLAMFAARATMQTMTARTDAQAQTDHTGGYSAAFAPERGRFSSLNIKRADNASVVYLPLRVESPGASHREPVILDSIRLRATYDDGSYIDSRRNFDTLNSPGSEARHYEFRFSERHWMAYASRPANVELTVWLTALAEAGSLEVPLDRRSYHPEIGVCSPEERVTLVEVACLQADPVERGLRHANLSEGWLSGNLFDSEFLSLPVTPGAAFVQTRFWASKKHPAQLRAMRVSGSTVLKVPAGRMKLEDWTLEPKLP